MSPKTDIYETSKAKFVCTIQLPINSPLKEIVRGPSMDSRDLAMKLAAFKVCTKLQQIQELDDMMQPIGKDNTYSLYK